MGFISLCPVGETVNITVSVTLVSCVSKTDAGASPWKSDGCQVRGRYAISGQLAKIHGKKPRIASDFCLCNDAGFYHNEVAPSGVVRKFFFSYPNSRSWKKILPPFYIDPVQYSRKQET